MNFYLTALLLGLGLSSLGFGIFISMRIFNIPDITTDGSYTLGSAVTAVMLLAGIHPLLVLPVSFFAGAASGCFTGIIHTRLKVNALLAGILVMTALYSINLVIMGRSNVPLIEIISIFDLVPFSATAATREWIALVLITLLIWFIISWMLRTDFGLAMRATGNSESMIRALGVNTDRMKIIGLGIANGLTALSGSLICQYQGFADINMGIGIVIAGLGSVMIGDTLTGWLKFNTVTGRLLGVIAGSVLFRLILAFALSLGLDPNLLKLITALFVLGVVSFPLLSKRR